MTRNRVLTPLAAAGLLIIMIGATAMTGGLFPLTAGLLAASVAWGRGRALAS